MKRTIATLVLSASLIGSAQAYTPSSGFWYNPTESGTGIAIEIEDKLLFMAAYVYDTQGRPTWVLSSGNLTATGSGAAAIYNVYNGALDGYANGQYIGGPYFVPQYFANASGPVQIIFNPNDETKATLTWGGRTTQIQRTDYYAGFGAADREIQRMIGEWSILVDLSGRGGDYNVYPYYGDVLVFDLINRAPNPDFYEGCRPDTSLAGFCSNNALSFHEAAGYYDAVRDEHVAVVVDAVPTQSTPALYWAYYMEVNVSDFEGVVELYAQNETAGDGPFYPVRGNRSGSRSFVLTGNGPSAQEDDGKAARAPVSMAKQIMDQNGGVMPQGYSAEEVMERFGIDVKAHQGKVREIQASLGKK
jgi:hypothetical protein